MVTKILYLFLFFTVPFIVGSITKIVSSSLNTDLKRECYFTFEEPFDGLGYWLDGFGILIIAVPLLMAIIILLIMPWPF